MFRNINILGILSVLLISQVNVFAYGDSFSCQYGKQAACLDYNDKVCSSLSKCVSSDAICFDSYTCNYQGFICKSVFQELSDEYDDLVNKYNNLVSKRNNQMSCLSDASTMDDVQNCLLY